MFSSWSFIFVWCLCVYNVPEVSSALEFPVMSVCASLQLLRFGGWGAASPFCFSSPVLAGSSRPGSTLPTCLAVVSTLLPGLVAPAPRKCSGSPFPDPCSGGWSRRSGSRGGEVGLSWRGLQGLGSSPFLSQMRGHGPRGSRRAEGSQIQEPQMSKWSFEAVPSGVIFPRLLNLALFSEKLLLEHDRDEQGNLNKVKSYVSNVERNEKCWKLSTEISAPHTSCIKCFWCFFFPLKSLWILYTSVSVIFWYFW